MPNTVLDDVGSDTPYYAAYNPKPDDEAEFLKHGIDLQVNYIAHATTLSRVSCTLMWSPLSPRHCGLDVAGVERDHVRLPHPSDAVLTYEPCFIGAQARVEGYFSAARVGNAAIAEDLQGKLVAHLQAQLPELYERFTDKLDTLNAELSTTAAPSWQVVEQVLLGYGRMVQGYVERGSDPDEVEAGFGLFQVR